MATICNMGAEVGATTSIFPFTETSHIPYLKATNRAPIAHAAQVIAASPAVDNLLKPDDGAAYDKLLTVDLSALEPHINGPFTPDLSTPLSQFSSQVKANAWPETFTASLIGSCTNSSYEDMTRAESLVRQAQAAGLKPKADFLVTPGSEQIRATLDRDATLTTFSSAGATVLANACGPCIGQWKRRNTAATADDDDGAPKDKDPTNAIFTSYNRNFKGRNDGNPRTMNFLASPELVTAMSYAGRTTFNPATDTLPTPSGAPFRFKPPTGTSLPPSDGFDPGNPSYLPTPPLPDPNAKVAIDPSSSRLAPLTPFAPFPPTGELRRARVLLKVKGQCTTDNISAAGPWLKYKGHLPNISANTLLTATNASPGCPLGTAQDLLDDDDDNGGNSKSSAQPIPIPTLAAKWRDAGTPWLVVAEHNYGEGSAREHAALQVRHLGCVAVLAKSFARIHEGNLCKQGVVALRFVDEGDWERVGARDEVETVGLRGVLEGNGSEEVELRVRRWGTGEEVMIKMRHALGSEDRRGFIRAGSALNLLGERGRGGGPGREEVGAGA